MLTPFFAEGPVVDYATATMSDTSAYGAFARALLDNAVYPPPSQFEAWFVGLAHGEAEMSEARGRWRAPRRPCEGGPRPGARARGGAGRAARRACWRRSCRHR